MVPIITRLMPNSTYYGISDLSNTVISFGSALAIMGMYDAMYRMFFENDDEEYQKDITSTTLLFTIGTSFLVFCIMIILKDTIAKYAFGDEQYFYLVYLTAIATLVGATNGIISAPTRMQNKRRVYLIMNTISPVLSYGIAIPLLLSGHYIIALPLSAVVAGISSEAIFYSLNKRWFKVSRFKREYLKPLLIIAIPLLPNFLIYWVFNSFDKLMIVNLIDAGASGIYSVGSKLGHSSQLIYTAFAGGWQFFAFSTMKHENQVKNNSMVFEYLGIISFVFSLFIFAWAEKIFTVLFTGEYVAGFIVAPYLFLAPLLQMLFQVVANQFLVVKKTWPNMPILLVGAIINVVLNQLLIPIIGIEGAAISTLVGYAVSNMVSIIVLCKMKLHILSLRFVIAVLILVGYIVLWRLVIMDNIWLATGGAIFCAGFFVWLYRKDLKNILSFKEKTGGC
jgi:O-antigen/teichoic acid export membrane protein